MQTYWPGDQPRLYITSIQTSSGGAVDPTPLKLTYWTTTGGVTIATTSGSVISQDSTGNWHADLGTVTSGQAGLWWYRWWSTGSNPLSEYESFRVLDVPKST